MYHNVTDAPDLGFCPGGWQSLCLNSIHPSGLKYFLEFVLFVYSFAGLAIVCDDYLVQSLETLCARWNIREDVAGASFVAFGSAAPEIIINSITTLKSAASADKGADLGVAAIIGSGMIAFLLIPGTCGIFALDSLALKRRPLIRDTITYGVALLLLCVFMSDARIQLWESCILVALYVVYILVVYLAPKVRHCLRVWKAKKSGGEIKKYESFVKRKSNEENLLSSEEKTDYADEMEANSPQRLKLANSAGDTAGLVIESGLELETVEEMEVCCICLYDGGCRTPTKVICGKSFNCCFKWGGKVLVWPLKTMFKYTCPPCELESKWERLYPLTFLSSFLWVALWSFLISTIVELWVDDIQDLPFIEVILGKNAHLVLIPISGVVLIAIGAEIPDTIQSVLYARQGYGSMAVSNSTGSQICNILIGLGLPWLLATASGYPDRTVHIPAHNVIQTAAFFQAGNMIVNFALLLGMALITKDDKARLSKIKGYIMVALYFVVTIVFCVVVTVMNK